MIILILKSIFLAAIPYIVEIIIFLLGNLNNIINGKIRNSNNRV